MSNKPLFIWERYNKDIMIHKDLKYLFYYRGCFCPPHGGHFDLARKYLKYPNVRMIIHQIGNSRHNISTNDNRRIWQWYIDELLPEEQIELVQYNSNTKDYPKNHPWLKDVDVLVILRGDEADDTQEEEESQLSAWKYLIKKCNKYNIDVIFVYVLRDHDKRSATSLIKEIIQYKEGYRSASDVYKYLPRNLSIKVKKKILHLLVQYNLI
jgi:phosphopantetheine adenylyltransferase